MYAYPSIYGYMHVSAGAYGRGRAEASNLLE